MSKNGIEKVGRNKWRVRARVWFKTGKIVQKQETISGTKEQALTRFVELKTEIREGKKPVECSLKPLSTFGELLEIYKAKKGLGNQSQTSKYNRLYKDLKDVPIEEAPDRFEQYMSLYRITPTRRGKPPSNSSVNRFVEIVRAAFNLGIDLKIIKGENPITKARFPKLKEIPRDRVLTEDDKQRLLNVIAQEKRWRHLLPLVNFSLQVPCRRSELVNMTKNDLDLIHNAIRVRNGTTKNDRGTWKPIPPDMVEYFRTLPNGTEYLFYRKVGGNPRRPEIEYRCIGDFKKAWKAALRKAGIEDYRFHDTRHNSASDLINSGTPEQVVLEVAGWKTNMLRTYYHQGGRLNHQLINWGDQARKKPNPENILKTFDSKIG